MPTEEEILAAEAAALAEARSWAAEAAGNYRNRPVRTKQGDVTTSTRTDVMTTFHFYVQISGITEAVFTQLDGLDAETKVDYISEGGVNDHQHTLLGPTKVSDITLRNGITVSTQLWDWYKKVIQGPPAWGGKPQRKHVSIVMVDQEGKETHRWDLQGAIPVKWTGPQFNSGQVGTAVQALKLTHQGLILR